MAKSEWSEDDWYAKAARYCAAAEHCPQEVRDKLRQWEYDGDTETLLRRLREDGYTDDRRYCRAYVHDKTAFQGWGKRKIQAMLLAKRLPEEEINAALAETDEEDYRKTLLHLAEQKKGLGKEKLLRFLLQRGFAYQEITESIPAEWL